MFQNAYNTLGSKYKINQEPLIVIDAPPSPNHVFNFLKDEEFEEDLQEEPEKEPEEELEVDAEEDAPPAATPPVGSLITLPSLSESSSDYEAAALVVANENHEMPPPVSIFEVGGPSSVSSFPSFYLYGCELERLNDNTEMLLSNMKYLERSEKKHQSKIDANSSGICRVERRMDDFDRDLSHERLETLKTNYALVLSDRDRLERAFYHMQVWVSERTMATMGQGMSSMEIEQIIAQRVTNAIEVITIYEARTRMTRDLMDQVACQEANVVKDVKNKREWESGYARKSSQQQSKRKKSQKLALLGQITREVMLGNFRLATNVDYITLDHALLNAKSVKSLAIMRKTVELGLQLQVNHGDQEERVILGTYHYATDVSCITLSSAQLSAEYAKGWVIKPRTAG
nr:hypothetical protein [Tanacetum cinerariifolium]